MRTLYLMAVVALILGAGACTIPVSYEEGSGRVIRESREVGSFQEIAFEGNGRLIIEQGENEALIIEAEDNVLSHIESEVRGGRLEIGFTSRRWENILRPTKPIRYMLTVRDLQRLSLLGVGEIDIRELRTQALGITLSGAGTIEASGEVDRLEVNVSGAGSLEAGDLRADEVDINLSGAGNAEVWAIESLRVNITGLGRVSYYGDPDVRQSVSGLGELNPLGAR